MPLNSLDDSSEIPQIPFRRYATRYEPARRDAWLAWWENPSVATSVYDSGENRAENPRRHFALLLDISHTGASVALDQIPNEDIGVWLRVEGDVTEWTEAKIVGMTITNRGPHLVRLAFNSPCAFETLRAAVCG